MLEKHKGLVTTSLKKKKGRKTICFESGIPEKGEMS
jgi:hypothetical protein